MTNLVAIIAAVALTALCWGGYGPMLRWGGEAMGTPAHPDHLRPFICVGMAYFLIAVLAPGAYLAFHNEKGSWTVKGAFWSIVAGALGAIGALGIIMAFSYGGKPILVMPLVFGCAPVVNTFFTMTTQKSYRGAGSLFFTGLILVVMGATCVLLYRPSEIKPAAPAKTAALAAAGETRSAYQPADAEAKPAEAKPAEAKPAEAKPTAPESKPESKLEAAPEKTAPESTATPAAGTAPAATSAAAGTSAAASTSAPAGTVGSAVESTGAATASGAAQAAANHLEPSFLMQLFWIATTAISWGTYGPILHWGQAAMGHSRLRPLMGVGIAYFLIAVLIPAGILQSQGGIGALNGVGVAWSLAGGAAGALGALGIIMAFASGGRPIYVMPLVFGVAPIVNTFVTLFAMKDHAAPSPLFYAGLIMVAAGAVMVLVFAPAAPKSAHSPATPPVAPPAAQ